MTIAKLYGRSEAWILGFGGILALVLVWQLVSMLVTDSVLIGNPLQVAHASVKEFQSGRLLSDSLVSLSELLPGFGLAILVGVPVGLAMGRYRLVDYSLDPFLWFFYSAPIIAFYPILIMWLGLGKTTIIALTFLFGVFPIVANTIVGVKDVDQSLIRAARSFGANELQIFVQVILPAAVPAIAAGLRLGFGRALIGTVVGEFFGTNAGLGFRIATYGTEMRVSEMFVPVIAVMVIGISILQLIHWFESAVESWRP